MSAPGYRSMASIGCRADGLAAEVRRRFERMGTKTGLTSVEVEKNMASVAQFRGKLLVAAHGWASKYIYRGRVGCVSHQIP
jgi:hypothetical protein